MRLDSFTRREFGEVKQFQDRKRVIFLHISPNWLSSFLTFEDYRIISMIDKHTSCVCVCVCVCGGGG